MVVATDVFSSQAQNSGMTVKLDFPYSARLPRTSSSVVGDPASGGYDTDPEQQRSQPGQRSRRPSRFPVVGVFGVFPLDDEGDNDHRGQHRHLGTEVRIQKLAGWLTYDQYHSRRQQHWQRAPD